MWKKYNIQEKIEIFFAACFYYSGLVSAVRWWKERQGQQSLAIVGYHLASKDKLQQQMLYLHRHYRLLPLDAALAELYASSKNEAPLKHRHLPVALTFDDGYRDNLTCSSIIARELQIPFTIFINPSYVESGDRFWWQEDKYLVAHAQVNDVTLEGHTYHLEKLPERNALAKVIDAHVRNASSVNEREKFLEYMRSVLAVPYAVTLTEREELPLTWEEIEVMKECKWITFGAHTMNHPILAYLTNPIEVQYEMSECRTVIEHHLKQPVRALAYPIGQPEHIGTRTLCAAQKAGYDWALTTIYGFNTPSTNPYLLHRIMLDANQHWLVVAAKVCGVWGFFSRLFWTPMNLVHRYLKLRPVIR